MGGGIWAVLAGYLFTFYNGQVQEQRKARIERVNLQLRDLYGPLLACVTATKSAYEAMVRQHSPDGTREGFQKAIADHPDGPEARAYRQWMTSVLQPLNEKAAAVVQGGFSLMEGSALEAEMLQLVAHVSASRVILERWHQGELGTTSAISYPDKLEQSVRREFSRLKSSQAELLGVSLSRGKAAHTPPQHEVAVKPRATPPLTPGVGGSGATTACPALGPGKAAPAQGVLQINPTASELPPRGGTSVATPRSYSGNSTGHGLDPGAHRKKPSGVLGWVQGVARRSSSAASRSGSNRQDSCRVHQGQAAACDAPSSRAARPHAGQKAKQMCTGGSEGDPADKALNELLAVADVLSVMQRSDEACLAVLIQQLGMAAAQAHAQRHPTRSRL